MGREGKQGVSVCITCYDKNSRYMETLHFSSALD